MAFVGVLPGHNELVVLYLVSKSEPGHVWHLREDEEVELESRLGDLRAGPDISRFDNLSLVALSMSYLWLKPYVWIERPSKELELWLMSSSTALV